MATVTISLPDDLKTFVDEQVSEDCYASSDDYIRRLLRRERQREHLRNLLLEGAASGPGTEVDDAYFERLRERIRARAAR